MATCYIGECRRVWPCEGAIKLAAKRLKIIWVRSAIGRTQNQRATIAALGLHRLHHSVVHEATPSILGMIDTVRHLVKVEEVS